MSKPSLKRGEAAATANRAVLQAALDSLGATGGGVYALRRGTTYCDGPLLIPKNVIVQGVGRLASGITFTHASDDGFTTREPINGSTGVRSGLRDLFISCNNAASAGGGFVDVGGTYIDLFNVY